jgi:transposase
VHHVHWWEHDGLTDLDNLIPVRLSHESAYPRGDVRRAGKWGMAINVRGGDRDQLFLMPPSVRDWLPDGHLAWFVLDVVAELDLHAFYAEFRLDGRGGAVYDPAMMLGVLMYAYCTGERSSRRIERRLNEDVAYRVLAANQQPDHATLARFRRRHQDAIAGLFGQVLGLCVKAGLVDTGVVAIDGTKFGADASFFANRDREQLAKAILAEAEALDVAQDEQFGDRCGDELPPEWSGGRDRRARIRSALSELDRQSARDYDTRMAERAAKEQATGRKLTGPEPSAEAARRAAPRRANTTDPHSRIIANASRGVVQGYNAQAAATAGQIVVAAEVTATANDQPHFVPIATAVVENLTDAGAERPVAAFVADAGYWTAANGTADVAGANVLIATKKSSWRKAAKPDDEKLAVLAKVNRRELSYRKAGELLGVSHTWVRDMTKRYFGHDGERRTDNADPEPTVWIPVIERVARGEISKRAAKDELCVSDSRINAMLAHVRGEATEPTIARNAMDAKLAEDANTELYKQRGQIIEPVFGNIKANLGYRRFTVRSMPAVNSEWRLICTAHNLLKLQRADIS